jgi:DNA-binding LacI/PurR family transcriptional regulator
VTRVRDYLAERGYVPSRQARQLRSGATECVGVLHCGRLFSHLTEAFNRIVDSVTDSPRQLEIMVVPRDQLTVGVQELLARGVSRLVWIHAAGPETELVDPGVFNYLQHVRAVVYNFYFGAREAEARFLEYGIHLVGVDRFRGMKKIAERLKRLGHRRVAAGRAPRGVQRFTRPGLLRGGLCRSGDRRRGLQACPSRRIGRGCLGEILLFPDHEGHGRGGCDGRVLP